MSRVYDKNGNKLRTYDENGREVSVISTLQASEEWSKQFHETLLAERVAVIEGACLLGLIAMQVVVMIRKGWK